MSGKQPPRFTVKTSPVPTKPGCWDHTLVEIYDGDAKVGEYTRNYGGYAETTFWPFQRLGQWYALYSRDYPTTSLMSLPDCKHLANTESGFCPTDFYVPDADWSMSLECEDKVLRQCIAGQEGKPAEERHGNYDRWVRALEKLPAKFTKIGAFGLVAGCHWGDDSGGMKVVMIRMEPENGKIELTEDLGYFQMHNKHRRLKDDVDWAEPERLSLPLEATFGIHAEDPSKSGFFHYSLGEIKPYGGDKHHPAWKLETIPTEKGPR